MAESANPTNEEFYDALRFNVPRISVPQGEILRRLEQNMPAKIAYLNDLLGYPEGKGIAVPKSYEPAPSPGMLDGCLNGIFCSVTVATSPNGARQFKTVAQVVVFSVDRQIEHPTQVQDALDRAGVAIGILQKWVNGCVDDKGRKVWRELSPAGHQLTLPQPYNQNYSGSTALFTMVMDESCNCWT